eukprot:scaffold13958_cov46-Cyclotella_meneghiniana.AAC.1
MLMYRAITITELIAAPHATGLPLVSRMIVSLNTVVAGETSVWGGLQLTVMVWGVGRGCREERDQR